MENKKWHGEKASFLHQPFFCFLNLPGDANQTRENSLAFVVWHIVRWGSGGEKAEAPPVADETRRSHQPNRAGLIDPIFRLKD